MTDGEKKTNRITCGELCKVAAIIGSLVAVFVSAMVWSNIAQGAENPIQILNDNLEQPEQVEQEVEVFRGSSSYRVAPVEQVETPAVDPARQWFNAYDAWRARVIYRKLHPRP